VKRIAAFYGSVVGKKVLVAVTGILLFSFVVGHMTGNLKSLMGTNADGVAKVDVYAHFLRTVGDPVLGHEQFLWTFRVVLLVAFVVHVVTVIQLWRINRLARPVGYTVQRHLKSSISSRWMLVSGLFVLAFVVFHILHFTTGTIDPARFREGAVYDNLYRSFRLWYYPLVYVAAMCLLALHLYHGVWSLFQTLGLDNPDRNRGLRMLAVVAAVLLLIGFCAVPVAFYLDLVPEPPALTAHGGGG
jgi:succinate dehydrogenase / fumarate reductase cytochrome b subunit